MFSLRNDLKGYQKRGHGSRSVESTRAEHNQCHSKSKVVIFIGSALLYAFCFVFFLPVSKVIFLTFL